MYLKRVKKMDYLWYNAEMNSKGYVLYIIIDKKILRRAQNDRIDVGFAKRNV